MNRIVGCWPSLTSVLEGVLHPREGVVVEAAQPLAAGRRAWRTAQASCTGSPRAVEGQHAVEPAGLDRVHHVLQRGVGLSRRCGGWPPRPDSAAVKTMAHGGPACAASAAQRVEAGQLGRRLVHAHQRREFAAFAGVEAARAARRWRRPAVRAGKHEQQLLRLAPAGARPAAGRRSSRCSSVARLLHQRRVGARPAPRPRRAAAPASSCRYWRSAVTKLCWRSASATAARTASKAGAWPASRASTSTTCRPKRLCTRRGSTPTSGPAEELARELRRAVLARQPAQLAALRRRWGSWTARAASAGEAVGLAVAVAAQLQQRGFGALAQRRTSTPGVTANSTWRTCARSPTR